MIDLATILADITDAAFQAAVEDAGPILQDALAKLQSAAKRTAADAIDNVTDVLEDARFPKKS